MPKFSTEKALRSGWETTTGHIPFILQVCLIALVILVVPRLAQHFLRGGGRPMLFVWGIIGVLVKMVLSIGLIKLTLNMHDHQRFEISDLFSELDQFAPFFVASLIYGLAIIIGTLLFIVPGIIISLQFGFFSYFIVDKKLGPIEALKESKRITAGAKTDLFMFSMLMAGVNLLGLLALGFGLVISIPTTYLARASVYRQLLANADGLTVV